jgi:aminopeptidase N
MKSTTLLLLAVLTFSLNAVNAQRSESADSSWKTLYRETPEKKFVLEHTRLEANFDIPKKQMHGKVWITLRPFFYNQDTLILDAKGMLINQVALRKGNTNKSMSYTYNQKQITIPLGKTYTRKDQLTVFIDYTTKSDEWKESGSAAITSAKGLYFINADGKEKNKPTQIWTQGETEATSVWCPTLDKPNQKTTNEILMTVPAKWVTLSNGKLIRQTPNPNGTRTDHWKMDQPHAPYLFFMGAGEFSVIKDSWKGKEVSYYVEKEYAPVARKIFGNTPEMMSFYSRITGVEFPWVKYAQLAGRDFVSGAMENTTATLHNEQVQQNARQLLDQNIWEETIAHELFHQWFGDYVTTESWSNLTVNESFANYGEYLWLEYKYGKDKADASNCRDMDGYLQSESEEKKLVRFYYSDKEDMFDAVSYNKGGRILHMLRNYLGDSAFFRSLNLYLTTNQFKAAEAHQLRLAFEEMSGKDLNWFFNQWYFGSGHPDLNIQYGYDSIGKKASILVQQIQNGQIFRVPVAVDLYQGKTKTRHRVWIQNASDTFYFPSATRPDLINFDGDKILLCTKKENKTTAEYIHQYRNAALYLDRREAIEYLSKKQNDPDVQQCLMQALKDPSADLRMFTLTKLDTKKPAIITLAEPLILDIASKDPSRLTRAQAIGVLSKLKKKEYLTNYTEWVKDSSYSVSGAALQALSVLDEKSALQQALLLIKEDPKGQLQETALTLVLKNGDPSGFDEILRTYDGMGLSQTKFNLTASFSMYLGNINDTDKLKSGIDAITRFRESIPGEYGVGPVFNNLLNRLISTKESNLQKGIAPEALQEQIEYIRKKLQE